MKRFFCALLVLLLAGSSALAEAGEVQGIDCPEQGFSTACEAGQAWRWDERNGLTIDAGPSARLMIAVTASHGGDFGAYFDGVLTPRVQAILGDALLEATPWQTYDMGDGNGLPGAMYAFLGPSGGRETLFRLFDTRWATNVCYTLRYPEEEADAALRALGTALSHYRPGDGDGTAAGPREAPEAVQSPSGTVACPAQGFSADCGMPCSTRWDPLAGLYVYLGQWGRPPYVLINVAAGEIDPTAFFRDAVTPHMRRRYGDDLLEEIDCGNLVIGERVMAGFGYRYRRGDGVIYMLRVLENREGDSVSYITKFPEDDSAARETAMNALTALAASFRRE